MLGVAVRGEIVGATAWLPPEAYPISIRKQLAQVGHLLPALPWGLSAAREALRGQQANRQHHPGAPHYFLRAVGVVPEHQGDGIGRALLAPVLERADQRQVGCYLTTAKYENVALYERFGFAVQSIYRPTPTWAQVWSMWRDSR